MLADGILDNRVSVDVPLGFADEDVEGIFRKFPADDLFNERFLLVRQRQGFSADLFGIRKHDLRGFVLGEINFQMTQFLGRKPAVEFMVPNPFLGFLFGEDR